MNTKSMAVSTSIHKKPSLSKKAALRGVVNEVNRIVLIHSLSLHYKEYVPFYLPRVVRQNNALVVTLELSESCHSSLDIFAALRVRQSLTS